MSGTPLNNFTNAVAQIRPLIKPIIDNNAQFGIVSATMKKITTDLQALNARIAALDTSIQGLIAYINKLRSEKGENTGDITGTNAEIEQLRRQLRDSEAARQQLQNEVQSKNNKITELTAYIEERERLIQKCERDKAVIQQDLERHAQQITALQDELNRLRGSDAEIKRLQAQIQQLTNQNQNLVAELQQKDANITGLTNDLATQTALAARLQTQLDNLNQSLGPLQAQIEQFKQDLAARNTLITQLRAENKTLNDEIVKATQTVTDLNNFLRGVKTIAIDPQDTASVGREITALQDQLTKLERDIAGINRGGPGSGSSSGRGVTGNETPSFAEARSAISNKNPYAPVSKSSSSYGNAGFTGVSSSSSSSGEDTPPGSARASKVRRRPTNTSSNAGDIFGTSILNAYGQPVNVSSNLTTEPSLMSSSTVVGTLNNPSTPITINGINTTLGELKTLLTNKGRIQSSINNRYNTANRALATINDANEVPQIFTANKINIASNNTGEITLSPTSTGGKKSKKTKKRRKIIKQTGGFEYSGKSKRRRFSVTRSSSQSRSSQRSSSPMSSYETQSSVPPKYKARGSKKSKM
jgi:peptidoglycan hydrolase CwlO-like protein